MSSLLDAPRLTLAEAARKVHCHVSTLHRWRLKGVGGVKLKVTRIGGRSYVLRDDLESFIAERSDPPSPGPPALAMPVRAAAATRALEALGA